MPAGFKEAYKLFAESGWTALACEPEWGGQGLPKVVAAAVAEMWKSANHSFSLCPLLTTGAIEALVLTGTDELKKTYLEKMVSGVWTGTMNLTEPSAGSDLAAVRTRAEPQADGSYKIFGQKIFITYGEHDMAENIIHLVLARTPTRPRASRAFRCSSCRSSWSTPTAAWARATTPTACRSSTSSASTPARPRHGLRRPRAAPSATWSARRIAASSTCSS
jgi:alkylation response protein AidB-like acyl-CoA dehydrogenase